METEFALVILEWSHFLRRTGSHFAGKCSSGETTAGRGASHRRPPPGAAGARPPKELRTEWPRAELARAELARAELARDAHSLMGTMQAADAPMTTLQAA